MSFFKVLRTILSASNPFLYFILSNVLLTQHLWSLRFIVLFKFKEKVYGFVRVASTDYIISFLTDFKIKSEENKSCTHRALQLKCKLRTLENTMETLWELRKHYFCTNRPSKIGPLSRNDSMLQTCKPHSVVNKL